jgi:hypothetical protein
MAGWTERVRSGVRRTGLRRIDRWVWALAGAVVLTHLALSAWGPYELHRDALLYLAMGEHLHLFRMDFPPFIALLAEAERLLGDSEVLIHVGPAVAHGALIVLAAAFAYRLGGGALPQLLTALVVATGPVYLRAGSLYQPVVFDQLWWTAALYVLLRIGQETQRDSASEALPGSRFPPLARSEGGRWALVGLFLGLGLLTKFTILVLGLAILIALLATPLRRELLTPWPWAAAALAFLIGSPSIAGQIALGFPFLAQFQDLQSAQLSRVSPAGFVGEQILNVGPIVLLAWGGGIWAIGPRRGPGTRAVAWAGIAAFLLLLLVGGKAYYAAPIWPALLGIGMAGVWRWTATGGRRNRGAGVRDADAGPGAEEAEEWDASRGGGAGGLVARWVPATVWSLIAVLVVGWGVLALPMGLPFLPPERMARYAAWLGVTEAVTMNTGERLELPQDYADMLGWEALADSVVAVYRSLPPEDREAAVILATNYGRAGAIDYYAGDEIPHAVAPVGSYWFWGPGTRPGQVAIVVGAEPEELIGEYFRSAMLVRRVENPWGVPEERSVGIVVARDPIRPLQEVWPEWRGVN